VAAEVAEKRGTPDNVPLFFCRAAFFWSAYKIEETQERAGRVRPLQMEEFVGADYE
jgi:hypothetical protein